MPLSAEARALLTLTLVPGIGPRLLNALLRRFGSAEAVLRATPAELEQVPHVSARLVDLLQRSLASRDVDSELELMESHQVRLLQLGEPDYPQALASIAVPPRLLFVRGQLVPADAQAVAVIGSRSCTSYGRRVAERLAGDLARAGYTVVSGLARGIDGCAHRAALDAGGRTVAVLAGGLARIYPPEHADLAEEIVARGALIAESPMRMEPMAGMFPARNRIISGLCRGVVVVEAQEKSGALITARHAAEQGREVFVVPGPVDSPASAGALLLLRQGTTLVRHADDVIESLQALCPPALPAPGGVLPAGVLPAGERNNLVQTLPAGLDQTQASIWQALTEPRNVDDLSRHVALPIASLSGVLMTLELRRIIRRLPGNCYERC